MTERRKSLLYLSVLLALLILFFSKILFTHKIVRAPDITNEFYWTVKGFKDFGFLDMFKVSLRPAWDLFINSGTSEGGGTLSMQFLFYRNLIFRYLPDPANIAWFMVLHLFFGAAGTFLCCRAIGASRLASFLGGLVFALAPENASLINAGHVQKIATISFAPWAFYFFERGFQSRRLIFFLTTSIVLAFQFFNMHWQIAYYTCLGLGVYGVMRTVGIIIREQGSGKGAILRLLGLNLVVALFFLTSVAISLIPLADWSKDTTRGVQSGANQGKGGLDVDEAMSWSLPPEETATFVIPGLFGFSRQEGAYDGTNIRSYYWGRMVFTQTSDYMGLLPWLLLPLPLIFRRDAHTWIALTAIIGGILFSMGKYTTFYWFLYEHFPGINHFRVPKMMMFLPVLGLGVLAARGLDLLRDEGVRAGVGFRRYLTALLSLPVFLFLLLTAEIVGREFWISRLSEMLMQPTRFEQGPQLAAQRWFNLVGETGLAAFVAALHGLAVFGIARKWVGARTGCLLLLGLFLCDVGRVDAKFMLLQDVPDKVKGARTPAIDYLLSHGSTQYRVLPMNGTDPMQYASNRIPVMFTSNPVQQQRWQDFLDAFAFESSMPDMVNLKYLVYDPSQYERDRARLGDKYAPVYFSPDGREVVLENRGVLPKAWLVPAAGVLQDAGQALAVLRNPGFDPRRVAVVESLPPITMERPDKPTSIAAGTARVTVYEGDRIVVDARPARNALLVLGEKYYRGWHAFVDGKKAAIHPVNHILRGVYLTPGTHKVEFVFDPIPFKIGKWLTLMSFAFFLPMLAREVWVRRGRRVKGEE